MPLKAIMLSSTDRLLFGTYAAMKFAITLSIIGLILCLWMAPFVGY